MYPNVNEAAVDAKQVACFERLKNNLLADRFRDRMTKPLGYWALPNDRRLPQALLSFPLHDVLARPFEELAATRGIGRKKLESLFVLLGVPPAIRRLAPTSLNCKATPRVPLLAVRRIKSASN